MIVDSATLISFFDRDDVNHWAARGRIELAADTEQLVVSPFVVAELELLVRDRYGLDGWLATLDDLARSAWTIAPVDAAHLVAMHERVAAGSSLAAASVQALVAGELS
ncbi:MAG: hypothetical protein JWP19_639 [Rhodoglobus sp.]|nr:hypothetical protein [Rhodoglobus sp.]